MIRFTFILFFFFTSFFGFSQSYHSEIGVEIQAANFSNLGGTIGGALKWAFVENEELAFGPSFRFQYLYSQNQVIDNQTINNPSSAFLFGGGGFLHYRFLDWFFLGTEIEVLKNPYRFVLPDKNWKLTAFFGGGISKDFGFVRLNAGILYDVADALTDPATSNPSPLSGDYFLQVSSPTNPNAGEGKIIPLIYRVAFFFPLNRDK
jgi:hypothetical protein